MLIHAHEEVHLVSAQPPIASYTVRPHLLERMAEMGVSIGVIDGCGQVELGHRSSFEFHPTPSNLTRGSRELPRCAVGHRWQRAARIIWRGCHLIREVMMGVVDNLFGKGDKGTKG